MTFHSPELLYQAVTNGTVDGGISEISFANDHEISATSIHTIVYQVLVAASHPLVAQSWLSLKQLQQKPWNETAHQQLIQLLMKSNCQTMQCQCQTNNFPIHDQFTLHGWCVHDRSVQLFLVKNVLFL